MQKIAQNCENMWLCARAQHTMLSTGNQGVHASTLAKLPIGCIEFCFLYNFALHQLTISTQTMISITRKFAGNMSITCHKSDDCQQHLGSRPPARAPGTTPRGLSASQSGNPDRCAFGATRPVSLLMPPKIEIFLSLGDECKAVLFSLSKF
mmetsp:Transcript_33847/g.84343  ORF Transcript_33847/g.84343 Transcript_33847/m.84343 type:complete len:151 (-) Transcript_33847:2499-2951(-)